MNLFAREEMARAAPDRLKTRLPEGRASTLEARGCGTFAPRGYYTYKRDCDDECSADSYSFCFCERLLLS
jgi:hypothetical protein